MESKSFEGLVMKTTGGWYNIRKQSGELVSARIAGRLRLEDLKTTNPIAVGDHVRIDTDADSGDVVITDVLPRSNHVVRQSPRKKHELHLIAGNVDQAR